MNEQLKPKDRARLLQARELIQQQQYDSARAILRSMPRNTTAQKWLVKLDKIAPTPPRLRRRVSWWAGGGVLVGLCLTVLTLVVFRDSVFGSNSKLRAQSDAHTSPSAVALEVKQELTPASSPTARFTFPPPPSATPRPTETTLPPSATPTPTPLPSPACITPGSGLPFAVSDFAPAMQAVYDTSPSPDAMEGGVTKLVGKLLNSGVTADEVQDALASIQSVSDAMGPTQMAYDGDLNGDGKLDMVLDFAYGPDSRDRVIAFQMVFECVAGQFHQVFFQAGEAIPYMGERAVLALQDLNGDSVAELVSSYTTFGSGGGFQEMEIANWDGEAWVSKVAPDAERVMANATFELVLAENGIGYTLEMINEVVPKANTGPTRPIKVIWYYDNVDGYWHTRDEVQPSNYRIHVLHDADQAVRDGDYALAFGLYKRVVFDDTLDDAYDWDSGNNPGLAVRAYASFRLVVTQDLLGKPAAARALLADMDSAYPAGTRERPYVEMATAFQSAFEADGIETGCQTAQLYAYQYHADVVDVLGSQYYGYFNPDYAIEDICHFGGRISIKEDF
jgi:hypothetical protein